MQYHTEILAVQTENTDEQQDEIPLEKMNKLYEEQLCVWTVELYLKEVSLQ